MSRLVVLVLVLVGIKNVSTECFDERAIANDPPPVCIPGHWNIARLTTARITATSTCGSPPSRYCRMKPENECKMCNSSDSTKRHPVGFIVDKPNGGPITWWQSESWWDWYQRNPASDLQVNITLSFNKSFDTTGLLTLTFESSRPRTMVLEKSSDRGETWRVLQYYAKDCKKQFSMSNSEPLVMRENDLKAYCTQSYSSSSLQRGGKVLFDFKTRYREEEGFFQEDIQKYLHTTDLRFRLLYPATNGLEGEKRESILNQFFYGISDLTIIGRCKCNGHAQWCDYTNDTDVGVKCDCKHQTTGNDCEKCLPLYNNRTWMRATTKYQPNPCQRCECNNHSAACVFNKNLGFGVCQNCKDDTTGYFCHKCKDLHYRNTSLELDHSLVCPACNCSQEGITNNGSCNQTTGDCECRQNVTGRQCNHCVDTYYGYTVPPSGHCTECQCVRFGTLNGSLNCEQVSGQCYCKQNIDQRTCSMCKDGYYKFPTTVSSDCLRCQCDYGGSALGICSKQDGSCQCRKHIQGTQCTTVQPGYFTGSLTHFKFEAEDAEGNYDYTANTIDLDKYFTGTGYAQITGSQFVHFLVKTNTSFNGYILIRYTNVSVGNNSLKIDIKGHGDANSSRVNATYHITGLQKGYGKAWVSPEAFNFDKGVEYSINVSISNQVEMNSSILIDSLILYVNVTNTRIYDIAKTEGHAHEIAVSTIEQCWNNWTTLVSARQSQLICRNITFSVMAQVLDGALPCRCNSTGSVPTKVCDPNGGQCVCRPGVTGRTCDRCMPGFYNFTSQGCSACSCDIVGSHHLVCDAVTGQCPCKPGVVSRTCSSCNHTYYGFNTGRGCVECSCNASGAADMQCHGDTGRCPCKNSTAGDKCDKCNHGYFNYTSTGCQACNCDQDGSKSLQCHLQTGNCTCKQNVLGFKCDQCSNGTYNRDADNPYGCSPCYCLGRSNTCSSASGFVKTVIESSPVNEAWNPSLGLASSQVDNDAWKIDFVANTVVSLALPQKFRGMQMNSYGELLTFEIGYVSAVDMSWAVVIEVLPRNVQVRFPVQPPPSLNVSSYSVRFHESNATPSISGHRLKEIMTDIFTLKLEGTFNSSGSLFIKNGKLHTAVRGTVGRYAGNVENCTCTDGNYTGLSCQKCGEGYTRTPLILGTLSDGVRHKERCELCRCTNRSKECDGETGQCDNCRIGSKGNFCESCQHGVDNTTSCTQCFPEYYGLYLPRASGCQQCNCLLPNTQYGNQTVCAFPDGQCNCKYNISGRRCDRCHENAYNNSQGHCKDCPECYRLLQVFVHGLRTSIQVLEQSIASVRNGGMGDLEFKDQLQLSINRVSELVLKARNSSSVEKELHKELQKLNKTLDNMESLLRGEVTSGVTSLEGVVAAASRERNQTRDLIQATQRIVNQGYSILNMTISSSVSQARVSEEYLAQMMHRIGAFANEATALADKQNKTGEDITDERLAAEGLVRDAGVISLQTASDHKVNSELIRKLLAEAEAIKGLGVLTNLTANAVFANSSAVLSAARSALQSATALDPNNTAELLEIAKTTQALSASAAAALVTVDSLNRNFSTLISGVKKAVKGTALIMSRVTKLDQDSTAILNEARRAEAEARSAVTSAAQTHQQAKEMLSILKKFDEKAIESQQLAALALEQSKEANQTSRTAIEYSQNISASIKAALRIATQGLAMATRALNLAKGENANLSAVHSQALELQTNAYASKHTPEILTEIKHNTTSIDANVTHPIKTCTGEYRRDAKYAREKSVSAEANTKKASSDINSAKIAVDKIMADVPRLQQVNETRLHELQAEIARLRTEFENKDVKQLNAELKAAQQQQRRFLDDYKKQIKELRAQVHEMKQLRNSLSSVAYKGCT